MLEEPVPTARELLTQEFLALPPTLPLVEAVDQLQRNRWHTAFVVDDQGRLVGLLSDKDCLRAVAARVYDESAAEVVADVMLDHPPCVSPGTDVYTLAQFFLTIPAGLLPVLDGERLIGGVSQLAALRALLGVLRHRTTLQEEGEQVRQDLTDRPTSIERMQRVFADWTPEQIASVLKRSR